MDTTPTTTVDQIPNPLPPGFPVLDVREPVEWEHGRIDGAVHIPLGELAERISEVPEGQVLVVCKMGGRSAQATDYLVQNGHDAVNLDGGMLEWAAAGRPMVADTDDPTVV